MPRSARARTAAGAALAVLVPVVACSFASPAAALPDKTVTRSSPGGIAIPEVGAAVPAASPVVVEPGFGRVSDVDVTFTDLIHACPDNLVATLVGPVGQRVVLMHEAARGVCSHAAPLDVTFDDEALTTIPDQVQLAAGTYRPTDRITPDPAPLLSVFDGQQASGTWQLVIEDEVDSDGGYVGSWSLDIDYNDTVVPSGTVSINGGAASTGSTAVTLAPGATDGTDGTGVAQMRFSNDGTTWSPFRPYASTATWSLAAGDGTKTVWSQYADGIGNLSAPVSDTIGLDTTAPQVTRLTPKKSTGVATRTTVALVASEALDRATITRRTVRLTRNGTTMHAKVSYAPATRTVTLTPQKALAPHRTYKIKISPKVTDLVGNRVAKTMWQFTTR